MVEIHPSGRKTSELLADMCESALRLLSAAPAKPLRVRVQTGDVVVEAEWSADAARPEPAAGSGASDEPVAGDQASRLAHVRAPMVGTFYHAPEPGARPFVSTGEKVEPGQQVGIVESMKLMNPIQAEDAGVVVGILVPDATPVEYDQPLITIEPVEL